MNANQAHRTFNFATNWQPTIVRYQHMWTFTDIDGHPWPIMFPTKEAANEMAMRHKDLVCREAMETIRNARGDQSQ